MRGDIAVKMISQSSGLQVLVKREEKVLTKVDKPIILVVSCHLLKLFPLKILHDKNKIVHTSQGTPHISGFS